MLNLWRGTYLSREKEEFLRWPHVADTIYGMILLHQWLDPDERPLPSEAEQVSLIEQAEAEKASAFILPQEAIDYVPVSYTHLPIPGTTFTIEGIDSDYRNDVTTGEDGTVLSLIHI